MTPTDAAPAKPSEAEAREIMAALRTGVVPAAGLQYFATGLDALMDAMRQERDDVAAGAGSGRAKWVRGSYGSGKTFATRLMCAQAVAEGFATAEVQISVTDTPLHRLETVYRRLMERLSTPEHGAGAFPSVVDAWLYQLGDEVMRLQGIREDDPAFAAAVSERLENRLLGLSQRNPTFARVLRGYHEATCAEDFATASGLLAWLSGDPSVAQTVKRGAGVRGQVDGPAALTFLRGVLQILRESGYRGLVLVLDEVETVQRMRGDTRERALNALRQLVDMLLGGDLPGLYLVITGTPELFDGYHGLRALPPLAARVATRFGDDPRFDNLRAPQVRLLPFDAPRLAEVGRKVRRLYPATNPDRVFAAVDDPFVDALVARTTDAFGGQVAVAPRVFLRELVDVLDRADQHPAYDPRRDYNFTLEEEGLAPEELAAAKGPPGGDAQAEGSAPDPPPRRLE